MMSTLFYIMEPLSTLFYICVLQLCSLMEEVNDCFSLFRLPKFYEVRTNKANWLSSTAFFTSMVIRFFSLLHSWVRATTLHTII